MVHAGVQRKKREGVSGGFEELGLKASTEIADMSSPPKAGAHCRCAHRLAAVKGRARHVSHSGSACPLTALGRRAVARVMPRTGGPGPGASAIVAWCRCFTGPLGLRRRVRDIRVVSSCGADPTSWFRSERRGLWVDQGRVLVAWRLQGCRRRRGSSVEESAASGAFASDKGAARARRGDERRKVTSYDGSSVRFSRVGGRVSCVRLLEGRVESEERMVLVGWSTIGQQITRLDAGSDVLAGVGVADHRRQLRRRSWARESRLTSVELLPRPCFFGAGRPASAVEAGGRPAPVGVRHGRGFGPEILGCQAGAQPSSSR